MRTREVVSFALISLLIVATSVFLTACPGGVTGSGNVVSETRDVQSFDEISLSGVGNLIIEQGDKESLRIEAEDNIIPLIITEVDGNRLEIRYRRYGFLRPTEPINFFVTVDDLSDIRLSGSGNVRSSKLNTDQLNISTSGSSDVDLDITATELTSRSSGSSDFNLSGEVDRQRVDISGSGRYLARDLESKECDINISGSGSATVSVSDRLDIDISGSGQVSYIGDPTVNQNVSGSGRVRKLPE